MGNITQKIYFPIDTPTQSITKFLETEKKYNTDIQYPIKWHLEKLNNSVVLLIYIGFRRCDCSAHNRMCVLLEKLENIFPNAHIEQVDYSMLWGDYCI